MTLPKILRTFAILTAASIVAAMLTLALKNSEAAPAFEVHEFRWAYDNGASPGDRSGSDDESITVKNGGTSARNPIVRLRWALADVSGSGVSGASLKLQYTTDDTWSSGVRDVGGQGTTGEKWRYRDSSYVTSGAAVTAPLLGKAHGVQAGTVFEHATTSYTHPADRRIYEEDFSLEYIGNESASYYFRIVINGTPAAFTADHGSQGAIISSEPSASPTTGYIPHGWRWAADTATRPADRSGADDAVITIKKGGTGTADPAVRLRWVIIDPGRGGMSNASVKLQYTTDPTWATYAYVGRQGAIGPKWRFRASSYLTQFGTTVMPKLVIAHNATAGLQLEDESAAGANLPADLKYYEMDFSLEYQGNDTKTYYFRLVVNGAPTNFTAMHGNQGAIINTAVVPVITGQAWRWGADDGARPSDRSGADNIPITVKKTATGSQDPVVRLRHVMHDHAGAGVTNASIDYQYSTDPSFTNGVQLVGAQGATSGKWRYRNSAYTTHFATAAGPALTAANSADSGKVIEQADASGYNQPSGFTSYENDLSLEYIGDETATYYFRPVINGVPAVFDPTSVNEAPSINTVALSPPNAASALSQYGADHLLSIPAGGSTTDGVSTKLYFDFQMSSPQSGEALTPKVEIRPLGTAFTGSATHWGSPQTYTGSPVIGSVEVTGLTAGDSYHWQAWATSAAGDGPKTSFGGNAESSDDVTISKFAAVAVGATYNRDGSSGGGYVDFGTVPPDPSPYLVHADESKQAVRLTAVSNASWQLSIIADGDLTAGAHTIPISNLALRSHGSALPWTPLATTSAVLLSGQSPTAGVTIDHDYRLTVSWNHDPGAYSIALTYTIAAP